MDDLDGDGIRDFAATAPGHRSNGPQSGRVYAYSSKTGELLWHGWTTEPVSMNATGNEQIKEAVIKVLDQY